MGNIYSSEEPKSQPKNKTLTPEQYNEYQRYLAAKKKIEEKRKQEQLLAQQQKLRVDNALNYGYSRFIGESTSNRNPTSSMKLDTNYSSEPVGRYDEYVPRMRSQLNNMRNERNQEVNNHVQREHIPRLQTDKTELDKLTLKDCDPFSILKSGEKLSLEELRNKYKKLALIHHPDRGGDSNKFEILMSAYKNLGRLIEYKKNNKSHIELKNNWNHDRENQQKTKNVAFENMGKKCMKKLKFLDF